MANHDVSSLIGTVKLFQSLPESQTAFSDTDILTLMDYEVKNTVVPLILNLKEEHLVFDKVLVFAANTSNITVDIPPESTGLRLRDVQVLDNTGKFYNIPRLAPEQVGNYANGGYYAGNVNTGGRGQQYGFFIMGNQLKFYPLNVLNGVTLRITYHRRLNDLCLTTDAGQITNITGNVVTVSNANPSWMIGTLVDFISGSSPYPFVTDQSNNGSNLDNYDSPQPLVQVPIVAVSGQTYQFAPGVTANLVVGQWMSSAGTAPFVQYLPVEAEGVLIQATSIKVLESMEDSEGVKNGIQKYIQMAKDLERMLCPRVEGRGKKLVNLNSILSSSRSRGTRFLI